MMVEDGNLEILKLLSQLQQKFQGSFAQHRGEIDMLAILT